MSPSVGIAFASNRGPVSFVERDGRFETKRGAGGLAGALDPVARGRGDDAVWIAAATSDADRRAIEQGHTAGLREELGYRVALLDIEPSQYSGYYDTISNRLLWFANHCLWDELAAGPDIDALSAWESAYVPVNQRFAEAIAKNTSADSLVLFQDYHLSLAPAMLREIDPGRPTLHFTHSSFCGYGSGIGRLPTHMARAVVEGMLGADLVGLHEPRWARNFLDCCEALGFEVDDTQGLVLHPGSPTWVRCYPIPIDAADIKERAAGDDTQTWAARQLEWAAGRKVIVRSDRIEPSKNIVRGFEAFGRLLDEEPSLRDQVCFIACLYPSRQSLPEYRRYAQKVEEVVADVERRHPGSVALFTEDNFDRSLGALLIYDCLLVNSIMDGMNLVSKEGPAINTRAGVLVLSRGAGSFPELRDGSVVIEDPLDIEETASKLREALRLPEEERTVRAALLKEAAWARKPDDWLEPQLSDLESIRETGAPETSLQQPPQ